MTARANAADGVDYRRRLHIGTSAASRAFTTASVIILGLACVFPCTAPARTRRCTANTTAPPGRTASAAAPPSGTIRYSEISDAMEAADFTPATLPDPKRLKWQRVQPEPEGFVLVNRYREAPVDGVPRDSTGAALVDSVMTGKIEVEGTRARLYVSGAPQPCLVVNDIKHGARAGKIALWAHAETVAYFGPITITRRRQESGRNASHGIL